MLRTVRGRQCLRWQERVPTIKGLWMCFHWHASFGALVSSLWVSIHASHLHRTLLGSTTHTPPSTNRVGLWASGHLWDALHNAPDGADQRHGSQTRGGLTLPWCAADCGPTSCREALAHPGSPGSSPPPLCPSGLPASASRLQQSQAGFCFGF